MRDLMSAPRGTRLCTWPRSPGGSAQFLDADQVARGITEGAVANSVRLVGRLLDDLGSVAGLQPAGAPPWRHPDRPAGLTRSRIRSSGSTGTWCSRPSHGRLTAATVLARPCWSRSVRAV